MQIRPLCLLFLYQITFFRKLLYRITFSTTCASKSFLLCQKSFGLHICGSQPSILSYKSYLLQIIIVNHFFFCKLRSLRTECQESPFRERQDCSKRVPFEAKPVWMEWKGGPFEEIKSMKSAKLYKLVDYWTGELYFEHSGSHRLGLCESWWGPCEGKFQVELSGETWCFAGGAWCLELWCLVLGGVNWANVTIYPAPYKSR